jgi:hypothetical protein
VNSPADVGTKAMFVGARKNEKLVAVAAIDVSAIFMKK